MAEEKVQKEQETDVKDNTAQEAAVEKEDTKKAKAKKEDKKSKKDKKEEQIESLENDIKEMKDKHIRLQAEFDNFRKRTMKEKMELIKTASEKVLVDILPVIDDFERALSTFSDISDEDPLKQGVILIYNKFQEFLKKNGIKEIEAKEKVFDTDLHEAITKIPAPTEELKGKIVDVIQKGYLMNDKVIRFSKVVIGE
ncbi:MAG TPA: nucleotide exchange factor GrpE [Sunxiuqinia sp.]|nr:nucleotide exchange factor GrpE [Sunxiuqinia sp.]